jgi:hypothetical protein
MIPAYKYINNFFLLGVLIQVEIFSRVLLRFSQRGGTDMTSHDAVHSMNIIEFIDQFVEKWPNDLTEDEIFLLYLSAWLHDTGMIIGRENHHVYSRYNIRQTNKLHRIIQNRKIIICLQSLALSHSSSSDISSIPEIRWGIRLRMICALFRIFDSMDMEEKSRCPKEIYRIIQNSDNPLRKDSVPFWRGHLGIRQVGFQYPNIIVTVESREESAIITDHFKEEILSVSGILQEGGMTVPSVEIEIFGT